MNAITAQILGKLESAEWFSFVGTPLDLPEVNRVNTWLQAVASCVSREWNNAHVEGLNLIRDKVQAKSRERYRLWNSITAEMRPLVKDLAQRKCSFVVRNHALPEVFLHSVSADLLGLALECEYRDIAAPGLFTDLASYYLKGHFPCGWEGDFPEGRLVVF